MHDLILKLRQSIISVDVYTVTIMTVFSLMTVIFYPYVPMASSVLYQNVLIGAAIVATILLESLTGMRVFLMLRYFYVIPVIYLLYDQSQLLVKVIHSVDYDDALIVADRIIFRTDPTAWFDKFSFPALTEYLQICYFLFYVLPIMQAVELWKRNDIDKLELFVRGISFCFFISYLLYFAMPAIGPRFTLHDYSSINSDLPGLFVTNLFRGIIDAGGGITLGSPDPASMVNRDCMPSGHTMMTFANIILAFRNRSRFRWSFVVIGGSLIISTVYLRYHYGVDVIVGAILAALVLPLEPIIDRLSRKMTDWS
ncbi:MAG: phosphatase PAP2 family protein [Candidatus Kapabacteria bacterium]|nr:phosphatase PAP2 family protein [Candidatus Kapabacteria bacterium]